MSDIDQKQLVQSYKGFFTGNEAGRFYMEQLEQLKDRYIGEAMRNYSVETLARASGVMAAIDLITNVLELEDRTQE